MAIMQFRKQKALKYLCGKHHTENFSRFRSHQVICIDPLSVHLKRSASNCLREVTLQRAVDIQSFRVLSFQLDPLHKICINCKKKVDHLIEAAKTAQSQSSSSSSQPPSQKLSQFSETSEGKEALGEMELQDVNDVFEKLDLSPVHRDKYNTDVKYEKRKDSQLLETIKKKLGFTKKEESPHDQILRNLRENIKDLTQIDQIKICGSALPQHWNIPQIQKEMKVSRRTAEHIKRYQHDQTLPTRKERDDQISAEDTAAVINFYHRLDVSRELPGAKDKVKLKKSDGSEEVLQRKLLLMSIREAHEFFRESYPNTKIGQTKFFELKPKNIEHAGKSPGSMITCVCKHHENPRLAVYTSGIGKFEQFEDMVPENEVRPANSRDMLRFLMCPEPRDECWLGDCRLCSDKKRELQERLTAGFKEKNIKNIEYDHWQMTDRAEKVKKNVPVKDFSKELIGDLEALKTHHFIYKKQYESYLTQKENLSPDEVIVVGDFSENYNIPNQDEIQSAYFSHRSATIHPFLTYFKERENGELKLKSHSTIMVTDNLNHDTSAVATFQHHLIHDLKVKNPGLKKINYWSDGAASQYKVKVRGSDLHMSLSKIIRLIFLSE